MTVLERDAEAPPAGADEIWDSWQRTGVNQFRLPHFFLARYRGLLDSELPEVKEALAAAGTVCLNPVLDAPEELRGSIPPALGGLLTHLGTISSLTLPS